VVDHQVEVRSLSGETFATVDFEAQRAPEALAISWSPDGQQIAVATSECVLIWEWTGDSVSGCAIEANGVFLPYIMWLP
jgi:hypothetical protein